MNIIVKDDKSVRLTQYDAADSTPIDIQNIYVHVSETVNNGITSLQLVGLYKEDEFKSYYFIADLTKDDQPLTPNYIDYKVTNVTTSTYPPSKLGKQIIPKPYEIFLWWNGDSANKTSVGKDIIVTNNNIADEHAAIQINDDRKIVSTNHNTLLKEDSLSQMITFSIDEYYDGISFLDYTKEIYVDYIPPNFNKEEEGNGADFLSDKITTRHTDPNAPGRILLQWIVPPRVTRDAGNVIYAISVINKTENYVWQTLTSTLQVLPNIGKRASSPVIPDIPDVPEDDSDLAQRVSELENFVANIDYVSGIDAEAGTLTQVTREDGVQTKTTHEIDDLYTNSTANNTTIITGGGAAI